MSSDSISVVLLLPVRISRLLRTLAFLYRRQFSISTVSEMVSRALVPHGNFSWCEYEFGKKERDNVGCRIE